LNATKPKIIITGPLYPYRGGIADFNDALAQSLITAGYEVEAVNFSLQYPSFLFPGKTQYATDKRTSDLKSVRMINSINPLSWFLTARYINKSKAEIVIFRFWLPFMAPALGTIAALLNKNIKKIAVTDNVIPHEKRPGDKLLTKYFLSKMDGFIAMAQAVMNDLKTFVKNKPAKCLYHPVYDTFGDNISKKDARLKLGIAENDKVILFFGFIRKYKGLEMLLEAMAEPEIKSAGIKLLIAGEYYEKEAIYKDKIKALDISEQVIEHTHFIPSEEVNRYFCAANCVVQPYLSATQSGVTQIAYHFGRPMIVTDVSGLPEMIPDGKAGYVVKRNAKELANAIHDFFALNKEKDFADFVTAYKENFSWNRFSEGLMQLASEIKK
jgi:D-inositol-3-phosphate glycosyltransferase